MMFVDRVLLGGFGRIGSDWMGWDGMGWDKVDWMV